MIEAHHMSVILLLLSVALKLRLNDKQIKKKRRIILASGGLTTVEHRFHVKILG